MERDDAGTLARLREIREQLIDPKIRAYGGHVVKTAGDGMLLEFSSADAALRCAVDVQRAMKARNELQAADERIEFRIGMNIGDIIVDGADIAGDGVNVAARLEALAVPGGICVSGSVREQIHGNVDVGFADIGEQQVKNIARPISVFRAAFGDEVPQGDGRRRWQRLTLARGWRWLGAGVLTLGLASIAVWAVLHFWQTAPAPTAPPLSVAILPFTAPTGSTADEQIANALTKGLALGLGRNRSVQLAAPSAADTYKGKAIAVRSIGRELNVRYVVAGEVRRVDQKFVVDARLIGAEKETQAWSGRLEFEGEPLAQEQGNAMARLTRRLTRQCGTPMLLAPTSRLREVLALWSLRFMPGTSGTETPSRSRVPKQQRSFTTRRCSSTLAWWRQ